MLFTTAKGSRIKMYKEICITYLCCTNMSFSITVDMLTKMEPGTHLTEIQKHRNYAEGYLNHPMQNTIKNAL